MNIEERYRNMIIRVANIIDTIYNGSPEEPDRKTETCFVLITFPLGTDITNYVSNTEREPTIKALRELADNIEKELQDEMKEKEAANVH